MAFLRGYNPEREMKTLEGKAYTRYRIALWHVGTACGYCGKIYTDADDFIARDPRLGLGGASVDAACWKSYDANVIAGMRPSVEV